jgi:hypothetical protein
MADANPEAIQLWNQTMDLVKRRLVRPAVWRAMERASPLVIADGALVLGFATQFSYEAGHLTDSQHANVINQALQEVAGQPVRFRIIEGSTIDDWEEQARHDREAQRLLAESRARRQTEVSNLASWEAVADRIARLYSETPMRQLPQVRADYLEAALQVLIEAVNKLTPPGHAPSENDERQLARVLDRVADRANVPATLVAYMLRQRTRPRPQ